MDIRPPIIKSMYSNAMDYWQAVAESVVKQAEAEGVIITVERASVEPLAMRNHVAVVQTYMKR